MAGKTVEQRDRDKAHHHKTRTHPLTAKANGRHLSATDRAPNGGRHQIETMGAIIPEWVGTIVGIRTFTTGPGLRVYDPVSGRFLQTDPVGYGPDVNWYVYVGDDPVNGSDPFGMGKPLDMGGDEFGFWGVEGSASSGSALDKPLGLTMRVQSSTEMNSSGGRTPTKTPRTSNYKRSADDAPLADQKKNFADEKRANDSERAAEFFGIETAVATGGSAIGAVAAAALPAGAGASAYVATDFSAPVSAGVNGARIVGGPAMVVPTGAYRGFPAETPSWAAPKPPRPGGSPNPVGSSAPPNLGSTLKNILDIVKIITGHGHD
jgi:RHS repeat-associated protein